MDMFNKQLKKEVESVLPWVYKKWRVPILLSIITMAIYFYLGYNEVELQPARPFSSTIVRTPPVEIDVIPSLSDQDIIHAALSRAFRIDQSCFDDKNNLWLIHATAPTTNDGEWSSWEKGWYYAKNTELQTIKLGNNTLSIIDTDKVFNNETYPDITGLYCKLHFNK